MNFLISKKYRISPYLFTLFLIGGIGLLLCYGLTFYFLFPSFQGNSVKQILQDWMPLFLFVLLNLIVLLWGYWLESYPLMGYYYLTKNGITVSAPLRKRITIRFEEIKYIGIDYCVVNGKPQFWIYASKCPIPRETWGHIQKLQFSASTIRVQYSQEAYTLFIEAIPNPLKVELKKGESVLRNVK